MDFAQKGEEELEIVAWERWPFQFNGCGFEFDLDGNTYASARAVIVKYNCERKFSLYAGQPKGELSFKEGHRLKKAGFTHAGGLRFIGGVLYFVDRVCSVVARIVDDHVEKFAGVAGPGGFSDGFRLEAQFSFPSDVVAYRDKILVTDYGNHRIRIIDEHGMVTSIATERFPYSICVIEENNTVFTTCHMPNTIQEVFVEQLLAKRIAGQPKMAGREDGKINFATFFRPRGIDYLHSEQSLLIATNIESSIRLISESENASGEDKEVFSTFSTFKRIVGPQNDENVDPNGDKQQLQHNHDREEQSKRQHVDSNSFGWNCVSTLIQQPKFTTPAPLFLKISPQGHLVFSADDVGFLSSIDNFTDPAYFKSGTLHRMTLKRFRGFEILLNDDFNSLTTSLEIGSKVEILHQLSGRSLQVPIEIIKLSIASFSDIQKHILESCEWTFEALENFVRYIYGSVQHIQSANEKDKPLICAQIWDIIEKLGVDSGDDILRYLRNQFESSLAVLEMPEIANIAASFVFLPFLNTTQLDLASTRLIMKSSVESYKLAELSIETSESGSSEENLESSKNSPWSKISNFSIAPLIRGSFERASKIGLSKGMTDLEIEKKTTILIQSLLRVHPVEPVYYEDPIEIPFAFSTMQNRLAKIASELRFSDLKERKFESAFSTRHFVVGVEGYDKSIEVDDWILWSRWRFVRRALGAGASESLEKKLIMPSHFPPSLLLRVLQIIYSGGTYMDPFDNDLDCLFVMLNGAEFNFFEPDQYHGLLRDFSSSNIDGTSEKEPLRSPCPKAEPGFEGLVGHCRLRLNAIPTPQNCLISLAYSYECGTVSQTNRLMRYVTKNWTEIVSSQKNFSQHYDILPEALKNKLKESECHLPHDM